VDFFKLFNDSYGHQAGDDALRMIATALKTCLRRPADLVARYGGEEFACVLPETSYEDALAIADELERNVRAMAIAHKSSGVAPVITLSLGLATRVGNTHDEVQDLIGLADSQLYLAKHSGRGRVCSAVLTPLTVVGGSE
jgi:diguanylate cyclase (GGDEF)-like protein